MYIKLCSRCKNYRHGVGSFRFRLNSDESNRISNNLIGFQIIRLRKKLIQFQSEPQIRSNSNWNSSDGSDWIQIWDLFDNFRKKFMKSGINENTSPRTILPLSSLSEVQGVQSAPLLDMPIAYQRLLIQVLRQSRNKDRNLTQWTSREIAVAVSCSSRVWGTS